MTRTLRAFCFLVLALIAAALRPAPVAAQPAAFALKDGDRVVFYGDSITDQRLYTTYAETYVVTRFPALNVRFVHSGWGGDRVSGGGGGEISERLERDVIVYKPTVVTIMLGMNDGKYKPFDKEIFATYSTGYRNIVDVLKKSVPGVRLTLIQPSPYDEVTRSPMQGGKGGGYNAVMLKFGAYLKQLSAKEKLGFADLNTDLVRVLEKANAKDPLGAQKIVRDRVHPGAAGHLIMAGSLLDAWRAPALVSELVIESNGKAKTAKATRARNTKVTGLANGETLSWTQEDAALPMPIDMKDETIALAVQSSRFVEQFNQQRLQVTGLAPGDYALKIDGRAVGSFRAEQFAKGLNLADLPTPMQEQAAEVHALTLKHNNIHNARWRTLLVPLNGDGLTKLGPALDALDALEFEAVEKQRQAARPLARKYEIAPAQ